MKTKPPFREAKRPRQPRIKYWVQYETPRGIQTTCVLKVEQAIECRDTMLRQGRKAWIISDADKYDLSRIEIMD